VFALRITVAEIKSLLLALYVRRIIGSRAGITYCRSAMSISAGWEANKLPRFYGNRAPTCALLSRDLWNPLLRIIRYFYLRNLSFFLFLSFSFPCSELRLINGVFPGILFASNAHSVDYKQLQLSINYIIVNRLSCLLLLSTTQKLG